MPLVDPVTMSSSVSAAMAQLSASNSETAAPSLDPIRPYSTAAANGVRHVHTAVLAAFFLYNFKNLVSDPEDTLFLTLVVALVAQLAYVIACLPPYRSAAPSRKPRPREKKKSEKGYSLLEVHLAVAAYTSLQLTFMLD
jgi:GPI ethanolamine phosphate transferase 2/3 subunit F